jgi:hypothetical protein
MIVLRNLKGTGKPEKITILPGAFFAGAVGVMEQDLIRRNGAQFFDD